MILLLNLNNLITEVSFALSFKQQTISIYVIKKYFL